VEAPRLLHPVDPLSANPGRVAGDTSSIPLGRYWWRHQHTVSDVDSVVESLSTLRSFLEEEGPFHVCQPQLCSRSTLTGLQQGVIGFSQGAALAAMITGWVGVLSAHISIATLTVPTARGSCYAAPFSRCQTSTLVSHITSPFMARVGLTRNMKTANSRSYSQVLLSHRLCSNCRAQYARLH
jgi:hypothetical protein